MKKYTPHLYKSTEWEMNGCWYCADLSDLTHNSSAWYIPCRILGLSCTDFILALKNTYQCDYIKWAQSIPESEGILVYCWSDQAQMRKFKNYLNKVAREKKFLI